MRKIFSTNVSVLFAFLAFGAFAQEAPMTPAALKREILNLMAADVSEAVIAAHVKGKRIAPPLSADDILDWKKAGIAEAVIQAALPAKSPAGKDGAKEATLPFRAEDFPLNLKIGAIEFHAASIVVGNPTGRTQKVTISVKVSNRDKKDHDVTVTATLLNAEGSRVVPRSKTQELEGGDKNKSVKIVFSNLSPDDVAAFETCRLEFDIRRH